MNNRNCYYGLNTKIVIISSKVRHLNETYYMQLEFDLM